MRLKLTNRFNLYIGGILLLGMLALFIYDIRSSKKLLDEIGISEAEQISETVFHQLYTSMRLGGGRKENRLIIERFRNAGDIEDLRIIHGAHLDRQFGIEEDELPIDELDRQALEGRRGTEFGSHDGHMTVRVVRPIVFFEDCMTCHTAKAGDVSGAVSVEISMKRYEGAILGHSRGFIYWCGGILLLIFMAILVTVNKRLLKPLESLKKGALALAEGDFWHRVGIKTGDEFEDVGLAFDQMAESLHNATERLRYLSEKHSRLVQMAADAILLKDMSTKMIADANPAASVLTGYSLQELLNMRSEDLYPPEKVSEYMEVFKRWKHDGKGYLHDAVIIKKDGFSVPVEIAASVFEFDGKFYMQEIWRDLTERKGFVATLNKYVSELEDTVRERTLKLDDSLKELETAYKKLQYSEQRLIQSAKLISLGEMGAGIAHELNSPIAGILSICEALLRRTDRKHPDYFLLEKMREAAVRSKYIILDVLTYSRPSKADYEPMNLNETIRATLSLFVSEMKLSSIDIIADYEPDLPEIMGHKGRIMEVALNLLKNARDAINGNGRIFISTYLVKREDLEYAVAQVRDTGPGISDEVKEKMFDPFFTTKEKGGGLNIGLGLSISQSIVKEHGGMIEFENNAGGGAIFRVYLPIKKK
ncbi:MAG: PAS domain S-box protein [Deltaproteobacteria bacterium]|nr:PAS domain S-box protein [Deltaproteobacteria bacterium]